VRSFTESYLSDTDSIVPLENRPITPINQNKKVKTKNTEQVEQINWSVIFQRYNVVNVR